MKDKKPKLTTSIRRTALPQEMPWVLLLRREGRHTTFVSQIFFRTRSAARDAKDLLLETYNEFGCIGFKFKDEE